ncbi:MAG: alpha/beta hydrolase [Isosphaeraceae bacterium]|nr:alpha/beta hydrolase [Isosphaeraceae bacterium]
MSDHVFEHDGIRFRYRDLGAGVPFVWQHGLGSDLGVNFDLLPPPPGTRLLGLDARGHGETRPLGPVEKLSIPSTVDDVAAWLDHLGVERAIVGGISMGAAIALRFACRFPGRVIALVLSRPAWLDRPRPENLIMFEEIAALIREFGVDEGKRRFADSATYRAIRSASPDAAVVLLGQFDHPRAGETFEKYAAITASSPGEDRSDWASIVVPTLILANELDPIHPPEIARVLHETIPGSELVEITPKSVSLERHAADVREAIGRFTSALPEVRAALG